jgi:hypothetical protein
MTDINCWAVLVSAVASMVIGSIWYGPLFGKRFIKEMGMDQWSPEKKAAMKKKMGLTYFGQLVASVIMFYVLAWFIGTLDKLTLSGGLMVGFLIWVGFAVPIKFADAVWGGKMTLFWLSIGNMLVTLLAAGAIIGAWN